jgi:sugar/nucleoside kinase (ribokinase family)
VVEFDDEPSAQAAARECRSTAFVALVSPDDFGRWILTLRRKNTFPADERDRYASRVRRLVDPHGGRYTSFHPDARELRPTGKNDERASR